MSYQILRLIIPARQTHISSLHQYISSSRSAIRFTSYTQTSGDTCFTSFVVIKNNSYAAATLVVTCRRTALRLLRLRPGRQKFIFPFKSWQQQYDNYLQLYGRQFSWDRTSLQTFVAAEIKWKVMDEKREQTYYLLLLIIIIIPVTKEPVGLTELDGKRPDGLTLIPWQGGKPLTWDVTVVSTLAASYLSSSARSAGAEADLVASRKEAKYRSLTNSYIFQPIAVESHGSFSASSLSFLTTLGERLTGTSGDLREMSYMYLFQRLSVIVQRFNSVLIHESFVSELHIDWTIGLLFVIVMMLAMLSRGQ